MIIFIISLGGLISNISDSRDSIETVSSLLSNSLTGKYGWYGDSSSKYQWSINLNNDETCLVIYREYEYYSATYKRNSDGTYMINIPDIQDTWVAEKSGNDLKVRAGRFGTQIFEKIN